MPTQLSSLVIAIALSLPIAGESAEPEVHHREAVLALIRTYSRDPQSVLSGQNVGHAGLETQVGYDRYISALAEQTGEVPAILSLDYGYNEIPYDLRKANELLIDHWRAGGLVMVSMHPTNPWTRDDCHDLGYGDFEDLFRPGTAVQLVWSAELDRVADGLQQLRDAGVVVLWRPFHEMNGGWFWWCPQQQGRWLPALTFRRLWRETFRYFTEEKQLDNLLWVYAPTVQRDRAEKPPKYYYPGDDVVDLVALDWYTDDPKWSHVRSNFQQLAETGKPMGLAEFGPHRARHGEFDNRRLLDCLQDGSTSLGFFNYWHSWNGAKVAIVDNRHAKTLMHHPLTKNRAQLNRHFDKVRQGLDQSNP